MARPIAASPAATVKMKSEKICPVESLRKAEKATKLILMLSKISSNDIKIIITFFLFKKTPTTPIVKSMEDKIK